MIVSFHAKRTEARFADAFRLLDDSEGSEYLAGDRAASGLPVLSPRLVAAIHDRKSENRGEEDQGEDGCGGKRQRGAVDTFAEDKRRRDVVDSLAEQVIKSQSRKDPGDKRNNAERESSESLSHLNTHFGVGVHLATNGGCRENATLAREGGSNFKVSEK
jgi:hypothetical protein